MIIIIIVLEFELGKNKIDGPYRLSFCVWRIFSPENNSPEKSDLKYGTFSGQKMRIISGKYPGFAAMWRKLVLMYEKGPWQQKSGKYPDIFRSKALNIRVQVSKRF